MSEMEGDFTFRGVCRFLGSLFAPDSCILDKHVSADAAIATVKMLHKHRKTFAQANTAASAETRVVHIVEGATGTIKAIKAGSIAVCSGNAAITVDLKKNGASVLSAVITLDSGNTARVAEAGTLSSTAVVAGDCLEIVVAVNAGTGVLGTGVYADLEVDETAL
jgi:hypothetical protein